MYRGVGCLVLAATRPAGNQRVDDPPFTVAGWRALLIARDPGVSQWCGGCARHVGLEIEVPRSNRAGEDGHIMAVVIID